MKNNRGSIFPFTVMIILLFFLVILHVTTVVILEKSFYSDTKQYYILDSLIQRAVNQSMKKLKSVPEETSYQETMKEGEVAYKIINDKEGFFKVEISCETHEKKKKQSSYLFDAKKGLITSWTEW
ncbi:competence type IV pilus minor pilin ComGG [Metabacillus sp. RGM 3146]|uniref:competence type IV pilus minor pilin ComGG n=1 Tax=Metabacillus sp. RGM 3146 TaxID=3401092 RepID=UPI003B9DBE28